MALEVHAPRSDATDYSLCIPPAEECTYTKCYCEENVWMLCDHVRKSVPAELEQCYCVFISNENKSIPLWKQKSSKRKDGLVIWDYHVILLWRGRAGTLVYDLDTALPFPCDFGSYMREGVRSNRTLLPEYRRKFRVVPAAEFLATFASDRSHMLKEDASDNNIQEFINMDSSSGHGKVHTEDEFVDFFKQ